MYNLAYISCVTLSNREIKNAEITLCLEYLLVVEWPVPQSEATDDQGDFLPFTY